MITIVIKILIRKCTSIPDDSENRVLKSGREIKGDP